MVERAEKYDNLIDPLVMQVVGDADNEREVRLLTGYAGKSSDDDNLRLYLSLDFSVFCDVPKKKILGHKKIGDPSSPIERVYLWVTADATITWGPRTSAGSFPTYTQFACPSITEFNCPPQTIHSDCPTPSFNLPCYTQFPCAGASGSGRPGSSRRGQSGKLW